MPVLLRLPTASVSRIEEELESAHVPVAHGPLTLSTLDSARFDGKSEEKVLLLTVGSDFHYRLLPHLTISHSNSLNTYTFPSQSSSSPCSLLLTLPFPATPADDVDQTTLLELLTQTLAAVVTHNPPALKNTILLIDDDTGEVVGEMDMAGSGLDDKTSGGHENGPVMIDLGDGTAATAGNGVVVTEVPAGEMDDWMLRGAANLGGKMLKGASLVSSKLAQASDKYVARTVPLAEPVKVSDRTKANLRVVNQGTTVVRSTVAKGTGFINRNIQKGMEFAVEHGHEGSVRAINLAKEKHQQRRAMSSSSTSSFETYSSSPPPQQDLLVFDDEKSDAYSASPPSGRRPPPPVPSKPSHLSTNPNARPTEISERPLISRLLLAGDVLYTSFESSTTTLVASAADNSTKSISHKYGEEAGQASASLGGSVKNVSAAFVDARGVGRRALVKGAGKGFIKTKMKDERGKVYSAGGEVVGGVEQSQIEEGQLIALANDEKSQPLGIATPPRQSPAPAAYTSARSASSPFSEKVSSPSSWASNPLPPPPPNRVVLPPPSRSLTRPSPTSSPPVLLPRPKPKTSTGWSRPKAPSAADFDASPTTDRLSVGMGGMALSPNGSRSTLNSSPEPVEKGGTSFDVLAGGEDGQTTSAATRRRLPPPVGAGRS